MRVGIAPAPEPTAVEAVRAAAGCGLPSPEPTTVPEALTRTALTTADIHLGYDDEPVVMGPLELVYSRPPSHTGAWFGTIHARLADGVRIWQDQRGEDGANLLRSGRSLLRLDPADYEVRVRHFRLRCPAVVALGSVDAPTHAWLSTLGHHAVTLGEPPRIEVALAPDVETPVIHASSQMHGSVYRSLASPAAVGDAFSVGDVLVEVVEVTSGWDTRLAAGRWHSAATFPPVHVQVRVSPSPWGP